MKTSNLRILHHTLLGLLAALGPLGLSLHTAYSATAYACTNFVGLPGVAGSADGIGPGSAARFQYPYGVAVDSTGNVYVADAGNNTIRKMTPAGVVTTLAGSAGLPGSADGTGSAARFYGPMGLAVDSAGNLYVAEYGNHTIRQVTPAGVVTTLAGSAGVSGTADGTGSAARFSYPAGLAVDSTGNVYVADTDNNTIRKVTPAGEVTTLAGLPGAIGGWDGTGPGARFFHPNGVAVDSAGNVYVADTDNSTIRMVTQDGVVTTLASSVQPAGIALDSAGNLFVTGEDCRIRLVTPAGMVTTLAGNALIGSADGTGSKAYFFYPFGVAVDSTGNAYVADSYNHTIRQVTPAGEVTTVAGCATISGSTDGPARVARFYYPRGVAVGSAGNVYLADSYNHTIRLVTPAGVVTTLAGSAGVSGSADDTGSAARFYRPQGVAVDSANNVYVADAGNNTIRKMTPAGVVTTLAGSAGVSGSADGTGSAARFKSPSGVAVDSANNVYVVDTSNQTIRKVTPGGVVTTLAGSAGVSGSADGAGSAARFYAPMGLAVDSAGNLYVADSYNHTIRKVTPAGVATTLAGSTGVSGSVDGIGSAARFNYPYGVAVDSGGTMYAADTSNNRISRGVPVVNSPAPMTLNNPRLTTNRAFQFSFSSTTGGVFSVLAATNLSVPGSNWVVLGTASETPPGSGQFQFTDLQSTNAPRQFYRLRWP